MILNPNKINALVISIDPGLWALPIVTWSSQGFLSERAPTSTSLAWSLTASSPSKTMCVVLFPVYYRVIPKNWYFKVGEWYICGHLCVTLLLFCICSPKPWVIFSDFGVSCWMSPSTSRAPGVFGGQALSRSEFRVVVSLTSCGSASYVVQG